MRFALLSLLIALPSVAETRRFGKPLEGRAPDALEAVLKAPVAGQAVRLEGKVEAVCRNKGCWLEFKQGTSSVHVSFAGYSFFVPKDSAGRQVVIEGRVKVKKPTPGEIEHLESEGASGAGANVSIEAEGVEIR